MAWWREKRIQDLLHQPEAGAGVQLNKHSSLCQEPLPTASLIKELHTCLLTAVNRPKRIYSDIVMEICKPWCSDVDKRPRLDQNSVYSHGFVWITSMSDFFEKRHPWLSSFQTSFKIWDLLFWECGGAFQKDAQEQVNVVFLFMLQPFAGWWWGWEGCCQVCSQNRFLHVGREERNKWTGSSITVRSLALV